MKVFTLILSFFVIQPFSYLQANGPDYGNNIKPKEKCIKTTTNRPSITEKIEADSAAEKKMRGLYFLRTNPVGFFNHEFDDVLNPEVGTAVATPTESSKTEKKEGLPFPHHRSTSEKNYFGPQNSTEDQNNNQEKVHHDDHTLSKINLENKKNLPIVALLIRSKHLHKIDFATDFDLNDAENTCNITIASPTPLDDIHGSKYVTSKPQIIPEKESRAPKSRMKNIVNDEDTEVLAQPELTKPEDDGLFFPFH